MHEACLGLQEMWGKANTQNIGVNISKRLFPPSLDSRFHARVFMWGF